MNETKDQTIARLEGEASGLRQARTVLIADRERLQAELAARQPDESPGDVIHAEPDGTIVLDDGITTWNPRRACEFLQAATRADAQNDTWIHVLQGIEEPCGCENHRKLAAARDERDRRIRLEEAANWFNAQKTGSYHEWAWNRFRELRAPVPAEEMSSVHNSLKDVPTERMSDFEREMPVPAEREPYPDNVAGCTCPAPCKGTRHGPRDLSLERAGDACQRCGGSGHLQMHNPKPKDTDDCPDCHGTGKVKNDRP